MTNARAAYTAAQLNFRATPTPTRRTPSVDAKYYRVRLAKGSPFSALKVWWGFAIDPVTQEVMCERPGMWRAILNGEHVPIEDVILGNSSVLDRLPEGLTAHERRLKIFAHGIHTYFWDGTSEPLVNGFPCDEIDYEVTLRTHLRAKIYEPDAPEANPRKPVNLHAMKPLF